MHPLTIKSQVREVFIAYKNLVDKLFQTEITTLYSVNGGELLALIIIVKSLDKNLLSNLGLRYREHICLLFYYLIEMCMSI